MQKDRGHIDEKELAKFLLGESSQQEIMDVKNWIDASTDNQKLLDQIESVWIESGKLQPAPVPVDSKLAWQKMSDKIDKEQAPKKTIRKINFNRMVAGIAAGIIISFGIFKFYTNLLKEANTIQLASTTNIVEQSLPDGTEIALNLNSKLSYPDRFSKNQRMVNLNGEAYFDVERNPKKPFIIKTQQAQIQVLGTAFNVNAFDNNDISVDVASGTVKVFTISKNNDTASVIVKAGNRAFLKNGSQQPEFIEKGNADAFFWNKNTLVFNESTLKKVVGVLESHYKVNIELSNPNVENCIYTGQFKNTNIEDIIMLIASTFNFRVEKNTSSYILVGNGCFQDE